jgi:hypothetical protein
MSLSLSVLKLFGGLVPLMALALRGRSREVKRRRNNLVSHQGRPAAGCNQ